MKVIFSESFDQDASFDVRNDESAVAGELRVGPLGLLADLEMRLGLTGISESHGVRVEIYRQALLNYSKGAFFKNSLEKDSLGVAKDLLAKRDELRLSGFDFKTSEDLSERLNVFCELETSVDLPHGLSDRLWRVIESLEDSVLPYKELTLYEGPETLGPGWSNLLSKLSSKDIKVENARVELTSAKGDLGLFQNFLKDPSRKKVSYKGDGSLKVLSFSNEINQAEYMAAFLGESAQNFEKGALLCEGEVELLNDALKKRGLSSLGSKKLSMARPSLQLIPLIQTFLWDPLDCHKVIEFLTHEIKPFNSTLAYALASEMSDRPGLNSDEWKQTLAESFEQLEGDRLEKAKKQYEFLFERTRYKSTEEVPVKEVVELFDFLKGYCEGRARAIEDRHSIALSQTGQVLKELIIILELVESERNTVDRIFLESLVRENLKEIVDESLKREVGSFEVLNNAGGLTSQVESLCWYSFSFPYHLGSQVFWSPSEVKVLAGRGVTLKDPLAEGLFRIEEATQVIHKVTDNLTITMAEKIKGDISEPHPLYSDLLASTDDLSKIIDSPFDSKVDFFEEKDTVELPKVSKVVNVKNKNYLKERKQESYSSMISLLNYPLEWFLHYHARIRSSGHFSISDGPLLYGNICHKAIENFFNENPDVAKIDNGLIEGWVEDHFDSLLRERGATLLLPGREDDALSVRTSTLNGIKNLTDIIKSNGYEFHAVEKDFVGDFKGIPLGGSIDLVLKKGEDFAVIDIKYSGKGSKSDLLKDNEDFQLCLYSILFGDKEKVYPTAYYLLKNEELLAKNNTAFKNATVPLELDYQSCYREAFKKLINSYTFRVSELKAGRLEVVNNYTGEKPTELKGEDYIRFETELSQYSDYGELLDWELDEEGGQ